MSALKMKIRGSETPDNPSGLIMTKDQAKRWGIRNMPKDLQKAGFFCSVCPGSRGWSVNYGKDVK